VHKKQTGGAGQYAKIIGFIEPMQRDPETNEDVGFESTVMGGTVPHNYIPAVERVLFCVFGVIGGRCSSLVFFFLSAGILGGFAERDVIWESHLGVSHGIAGRWIPHRRFFRVGFQELRHWGF
jgi:translation elongation factor EF-G